MPSALQQPDLTETEVVEVFIGDTLEQAMASAVASLGPGLTVRRARKVRKGVPGLVGRDRYEVVAVPAAAPAAGALESAFDALLNQADAAETPPAPVRRTTRLPQPAMPAMRAVPGATVAELRPVAQLPTDPDCVPTGYHAAATSAAEVTPARATQVDGPRETRVLTAGPSTSSAPKDAIAVPSTGAGAVPSTGAEGVPSTGAGADPLTPADAVPSGPAEAVPSGPADAVPSGSTARRTPRAGGIPKPTSRPSRSAVAARAATTKAGPTKAPDGWSRAGLVAMGLPAAVLEGLPARDPVDDLGWLVALAVALNGVLPEPADLGPAHPVVVNGHGPAGVLGLIDAAARGLTVGTITVGERTAPATATELALAVRAALVG